MSVSASTSSSIVRYNNANVNVNVDVGLVARRSTGVVLSSSVGWLSSSVSSLHSSSNSSLSPDSASVHISIRCSYVLHPPCVLRLRFVTEVAMDSALIEFRIFLFVINRVSFLSHNFVCPSMRLHSSHFLTAVRLLQQVEGYLLAQRAQLPCSPR